MNPLISFSKAGSRHLAKCWTPLMIQKASVQNVQPPKSYEDVEFPERTKLRSTLRVPEIPPNLKYPRMQKRLHLMRGPELVHNTLLHKQFGIIALQGGRMKVGHFEMVRLACTRKMDKKRMFAIWRIEQPWQPLTKKGIGHKMGGGKGGISEYVTPIKRDQVIIEVGGMCDFAEVERFLKMIVGRLPFKAMAVSQEMLEEKWKNEALVEELNINPWNMEYIIKNQMGTSHQWKRRVDFFYFGKYL